MYEQDWQEPLIFDWTGQNGPPLTSEDVYNSDIGRIIRNVYHPPWESPVYVRRTPWWNPFGDNAQYRSSAYIPGKQDIPPYVQLSTLTKPQHLSGLKVLREKYNVQPTDYPSAGQTDLDSFEGIKYLYEQEQRDYRLWAKIRWANGDYVRTLHLNPVLEAVYLSEYELKKNEIRTLPHNFHIAAQISLGASTGDFELQFVLDLKSVDINSLPEIDYPAVLEHDVCVMRAYELPQVCPQHSSRFILPYETRVSVLPLPDVRSELANYAFSNKAIFIASEKSLQCLQNVEESWMLPFSVEEVICPEGQGMQTVVVLSSDFCLKKECGAMRTVKAFRHLLRNTFTSSTEIPNPPDSHTRPRANDINCTCEGTRYEFPPPRSFKKWQVKNAASHLSYDLIIHSSHKVRKGEKEVILEPIVEWQPELGACKQSADRLRALALSLMLRPNAELVNVRLDYKNGNVIVIDELNAETFRSWHGDKRGEVAARIYAAIDQLRLLKPGQYLLKHEPRHGANAMVYSTQAVTGFFSSGETKLSLRPDTDKISEQEEVVLGKIAPQLSRALLPYHKDQGVLPLAFPPDIKLVIKNKKVSAALAKAKLPPPSSQPGAARRRRRRKKKKKKPLPNV